MDGLERDNNWNALNYITPEEVESVSVLRDAAAVALYGYRGINGVVNIVTKRGKYRTREINFLMIILSIRRRVFRKWLMPMLMQVL